MTPPKHLTLWQEPSCYVGTCWWDYYPVLAVTRDSDPIDRSNYRVARALLDAVEYEEWTGETLPLQEAHETHWAVGWVRTILVHKDCLPLVEAADHLRGQRDNYAVLDEDDLSALEWEIASEYWADLWIKERIALCARFQISLFAARRDTIPEDPTGQMVQYLAS